MEKFDLNVFVGTQPEQMLATKLLEYSIKKKTSLKINVQALYKAVESKNIKIPRPVDKSNYPRTPFSFQRFAIPELSGYTGRSVYVDSDMLVFNDIQELYDMPFNGAEILCAEGVDGARRPQFSVMVLDCDTLKWNITDIVKGLDNGDYDYKGLMYEMKAAKSISQSLPKYWNDLESYTEGKTRLIHFTDMHKQPWLSLENEFAPIWVKALAEAIEDGYISMTEVEDHISLGFIRPSIKFQLISKKFENSDVPKSLIKKDFLTFVKPHEFSDSMKKIASYGKVPNLFSKSVRRVYATAHNTIFALKKKVRK